MGATRVSYEDMDLKAVLFDVTDHVATITLNRPDKLNAVNRVMAEEVAGLWGVVRETDDIHAAVVRAAGERAFSTGLDRTGSRWWADQNIWNQEDPGIYLSAKSHKVWKPVIAAVNGICAGGAQYFINEADIVICSESATFFDPHANIGIVSALEPSGMLARGVPIGDVLRWALMGNEERIGAQTALRIGLVSEVVAPDGLWHRAAQLAGRIAARSPTGVQGTVRAIWEARDLPPTLASQRGMAYTHIGNDYVNPPPLMPNEAPEIR